MGNVLFLVSKHHLSSPLLAGQWNTVVQDPNVDYNSGNLTKGLDKETQKSPFHELAEKT